MTVLPIVERELRVSARRRNTYWIRVVLAAIAIGIGGWILVFEGFRSVRDLGSTLFNALAGFSFLYCLLAGLRATSDCLSEEKREGTLGLLFLTDLKSYDIVFGKMAANSLNVFCGLLALLPVMAVPLLAGGVAAAEVSRLALAILNTLFFSLSAGMLASALAREERKAMGLCFCILGVLTVGLPGIGGLIAARQNGSEPPWPLLIPSPGCSAILAFEDAFRSEPSWFWLSTAVVHGLAWLFLVLACVITPRSWQESAAEPRRWRFQDWWQRVWLTGSASARNFRIEALNANPFYWLVARDRSKPVLVWVFLGVSAVLWGWGWAEFDRHWLFEGTYVFTALALNSVLKVWVASEACWRFSTDRNSGALELVLATPLKVTEIIRGQILALFRQFAGPVAVVLVVELVFMQARRGEEGWVWLWTAGIIMLMADLVTLTWLGMWLGLSQRHQSRALGGAIGLVLVLPWVVFALVVTLISVARIFPLWKWEETALIPFWLVIGLFLDAIVGFGARNVLYARFRSVVTERFVRGKTKD